MAHLGKLVQSDEVNQFILIASPHSYDSNFYF